MNNLTKEVTGLYKECLVKGKKHMIVNVILASTGKEKKVHMTDLHRDVQNIIMQSLHDQAMSGKHI